MTQSQPPIAAPPDIDPVQVFIPYKNGWALAAYYLGIFSFIPVLGLPLGIAAFVCGLKGLGLARAHPEARGKVHAWIGVIVGGVFGFGQLAVALLLVVGLIVSATR